MAFLFDDDDHHHQSSGNNVIMSNNTDNNNVSSNPSLEQLLQNSHQQTGIFFDDDNTTSSNSNSNSNNNNNNNNQLQQDEEELLLWRRPTLTSSPPPSTSTASPPKNTTGGGINRKKRNSPDDNKKPIKITNETGVVNNNSIRRSSSKNLFNNHNNNNNNNNNNILSPPALSSNKSDYPSPSSSSKPSAEAAPSSPSATAVKNLSLTGLLVDSPLADGRGSSAVQPRHQEREAIEPQQQQHHAKFIFNDDDLPNYNDDVKNKPPLGHHHQKPSLLSFVTDPANNEQNHKSAAEQSRNAAETIGNFAITSLLGAAKDASNNNNNNKGQNNNNNFPFSPDNDNTNNNLTSDKLLDPIPQQEMDDDTLISMTVLSRVVERFRFYEELEPRLDDILTFDLLCWMISLDPEARIDSEINEGSLPAGASSSPSFKGQHSVSHIRTNLHNYHIHNTASRSTFSQSLGSSKAASPSHHSKKPQSQAVNNKNNSNRQQDDDEQNALTENFSMEINQLGKQEFLYTTDGAGDEVLFSENFPLLAPQYQTLVIRLWENVNRTLSIKTSFRHLLTFNTPHFPFTTKAQRDALRALAITSGSSSSVVSVRDAAMALAKANEEAATALASKSPSNSNNAASNAFSSTTTPVNSNNHYSGGSNPFSITVSNNLLENLPRVQSEAQWGTTTGAVSNNSIGTNNGSFYVSEGPATATPPSMANNNKRNSIVSGPSNNNNGNSSLPAPSFTNTNTTSTSNTSFFNNNSSFLSASAVVNLGSGLRPRQNSSLHTLPAQTSSNGNGLFSASQRLPSISTITNRSVAGSNSNSNSTPASSFQFNQQQQPQAVSIEAIRDSDPILRCIFGPLRELPTFVFGSMVDAISQHADNAVFAKTCAESVLQSKSNLSMLIPVFVVFIISLIVIPMLEVPEMFQVQRAGFSAATADWKDFCPPGEGPTSPDCQMFRQTLYDVKNNRDIRKMFRSFVVDQLWPQKESQRALSPGEIPYKRSYALVGAVLMKSSPLLTDKSRIARLDRGEDPNIQCPIRSCESFNLSQSFFEFSVDAFFACDGYESQPPYISHLMIPFNLNRSEASRIANTYTPSLCEEADAITTLQFAMYAPTAETLSWVTISVAVPKAGSSLPRVNVQTMNLKAKYPIMVLALTQIVAIVWLAFFTIRSYRKHVGWLKTICTFNNIVQTVLTVFICTSWGIIEQLPTVIDVLPETAQIEYIPKFDELLSLYNTSMDLFATWVVIFFISSCRLFSDFVGLSKIIRLLRISAADLLGLLVIFMMILLGFIAASRALFGVSESKFAFTSTAAVSMLGMFWGRSNYSELTTEYPIVGSIFFLLFLAFITLLLLNLLIAVITATVGEVSGIESLTEMIFEKIEADTSNFMPGENVSWFWFKKRFFVLTNVMLDSLLVHTSRWDDFKEMSTVLFERPECAPPLIFEDVYYDEILADAEASSSSAYSPSNSASPAALSHQGTTTNTARVSTAGSSPRKVIRFAPLSANEKRKKQQRKLRAVLHTAMKLIAFCCPHKASDNNHAEAATNTANVNLVDHHQNDEENVSKSNSTSSQNNEDPLLGNNNNKKNKKINDGNDSSNLNTNNKNQITITNEFSHRHFVPLGLQSDDNAVADVFENASKKDKHSPEIPAWQHPSSWNSILKRASDRYKPFPERVQSLFIERTIIGLTSSEFFRDATFVRVLEAQTIISDEIKDVLGLQQKQLMLCAKRNDEAALSRSELMSRQEIGKSSNGIRKDGLLPRSPEVAPPIQPLLQHENTLPPLSETNNNNNASGILPSSFSIMTGQQDPQKPQASQQQQPGNSSLLPTGGVNANNKNRRARGASAYSKVPPKVKKQKRNVQAGMCTFLFNQFIIRDVKANALFPVICILTLALYLVFFIPIFDHRESATWLSHNLKLLFKDTPWETYCEDANCTSGLMHEKTLHEVRSLESFYEYLRRLVIPSIFPDNITFPIPPKFQQEHADGLQGFDNGTYAVAWDEYLRRTSPVTLRQLRSVPRSCLSPTIDEFGRPLQGNRKHMFDQIQCYKDTSDGFDMNPIPLPNLTGTGYTQNLLSPEAYIYREGCPQQRRILGQDSWIPCSGFTAEVQNKSQLEFLLSTNWLDAATKVMVLSTSFKSTYTQRNPIFSGRWLHYRVEIFLELPTGGGIGNQFIYTTTLNSEHLMYDWYSWSGYLALAGELFFFLVKFSVYLYRSYTIRYSTNKSNNNNNTEDDENSGKESSKPTPRFKTMDLDAEVEKVRTDHIRPDVPQTAFMCLFWIMLVSVFPDLTAVERKSQYMTSLIVIVTSIFIKYFLIPIAKVISHRAVYLDRCLSRSVNAVVIVIPYFVFLLSGFCYSAYVAFGRTTFAYSTIINAAMSITRGTLGDVQFSEIYVQRPVLAVGFTVTFVAIVVVVMGTVLTALMKWSTIEAKLENAAVTFIRKSAEFSKQPLYADEGVAFYLSWSIVGNLYQRFVSRIYKFFRDKYKQWKENAKKKEAEQQKKKDEDAAAEEMKSKNNSNNNNSSSPSSTADPSSPSSKAKKPNSLSAASLLASSSSRMKQATRKVMNTMKLVNVAKKKRAFLSEHEDDVRPRHFFITPQGRFARPAETLFFVLPTYQLNELATALKIYQVPEYFLLSIALYIARLQVKFKSNFSHHFTIDTMLEAEMTADLREVEAQAMAQALAEFEREMSSANNNESANGMDNSTSMMDSSTTNFARMMSGL